MKSSNKLLVILTSAIALSTYVGASIIYANSSFSIGDEKTIQGNGQIVTQVRTVSPFNGIHVSGLANVMIVKGNSDQVNISTDQNLLPYLKTTVKNNQLYIGNEKNTDLNPSHVINIIITSKTLHFSDISAAGKITLTAKNIDTPKLRAKIGGDTNMTLSGKIENGDLNLAGKSDVTLCDMSATDIHFNAAGNSRIHLCGHASNVILKSAGKVDVDAKNFTADNLEVLGAGDITMTSRVQKSIHVTAFGKVTVHYYGNPSVIDKKSFGNVTLKKIGE